MPFDRFRGLDRVRTVHGDADRGRPGGPHGARRAAPTARPVAEDYDALVISTGVTNGFWRQPTLQSATEIGADLRAAHDRLAAAGSVIVVGGGAAAVSSAANLATTWPGKRIDLYFPGERALLAAPPPDLGADPAPADRSRRRACTPGTARSCPTASPATRSPATPSQWSTGQPAASRRCRAVGDRPGAAQHRTGCRRSCSTTTDSSASPRNCGSPASPGCSRSVTSRPPTRCAVRPATAPTACWPTTSGPSSRASRCVATAPPKRRWGSVLGRAARRAGGVRPERPGVPLPGLVDRSGAAALDRPVGHLPRSAVAVRQPIDRPVARSLWCIRPFEWIRSLG